MTSREQAVEVMAEAIRVRYRDGNRQATAEFILDCLLAARVPCPTCSGKGTDQSDLAVSRFTHTGNLTACPDCDDGRGGPLVLLGPELLAWLDGAMLAGEAAGKTVAVKTLAFVHKHVARSENESP